MTPKMLRDGMFNIHTRRFGTVTELMIKRLATLGKSRNQFHDLYDDVKNHRVEVKFSTVRRKNARPIREDTVLDCIKNELSMNRSVKFAEWRDAKFDCNIQQVKRSEFDVLYYGLFFSDAILIFKIHPHEIDASIQYSDKQHKGNKGEGQFHITQNNLDIHLKRFLHTKLTYQELLQLLDGATAPEVSDIRGPGR